jgi:putative ABC transport system permease protein
VTFNPQDKNVQWLTIVGVVADTRRGGVDRPAWAELYFSLAQTADSRLTVLVRTMGDPITMARAAQEQVWAIDPGQPVASVRTLEELVARVQANRRFTTMMLVVFAVVALVLAAVGIYGVIAYSTAQRTQEIGIRVALGAQPRQVLAPVIREALVLAGSGIAVGLLGAVALTHVLASFLFGIRATDPLTFISMSLLLVLMALLASYIPSRRALRVDPLIALRPE